MRPGRLTHVGFAPEGDVQGSHRMAIQASPSALRGRGTFVTVSLILRIVSNFEQSRHRRRYRVTKRNGLVYKPVVYLPKESFFNLMSRMEGE
jgi:hypothetical protein